MSLQTSQLSIRLLNYNLNRGWRYQKDTTEGLTHNWLISAAVQIISSIFPFILDINVLMFLIPCNCEKETVAAFISLKFIYILPHDNIMRLPVQNIKWLHSLLMLMLIMKAYTKIFTHSSYVGTLLECSEALVESVQWRSETSRARWHEQPGSLKVHLTQPSENQGQGLPFFLLTSTLRCKGCDIIPIHPGSTALQFHVGPWIFSLSYKENSQNHWPFNGSPSCYRDICSWICLSCKTMTDSSCLLASFVML